MSNGKNKTQFSSLFHKTYTTRFVDRNISPLIDEEVVHLTCENDKTVSKYPGGSRYMKNVYTTMSRYQNITA